MKKLLILAAVAVAAIFLWKHRDALLKYARHGVSPEASTVSKAESSANRARARVNQGRAIEANAEADKLENGMTIDEVRAMLGEPASIDRQPERKREVWHYPVINKIITFQDGRIWSVDPN